MKYYCSRCGYNTDHRTKFRLHLDRKRVCPSIISNVSISKVREIYFGKSGDFDDTPNCTKIGEIAPKITQKVDLNANNAMSHAPKCTKIGAFAPELLICKYCHRSS